MTHRQERALRRLTAAILAATAIALGTAPRAEAAWERFHGDGANRGFVDVTTATAGKGSRSVPGLGTFAPGAGPVIAPDGTVYLGTIEGKLIALRADGSALWSRDLAPGQAIHASPAIGSDGSVYVVGTKETTVRDAASSTKRTVLESTLHKFTASGGYVAQIPFPSHGSIGYTTAPPNIVRSGNVEAVIVPALFRNRAAASIELRLIAFSTSGSVLDDERVTLTKGTATGGGDWKPGLLVCLIPVLGQLPCALACVPPCEYTPPRDATLPPPVPGAAAFTFAFTAGDPPRLVVSDGMHDVVGYTFSPSGFTEVARASDKARRLVSSPMVMPDGDTFVGTADGALMFGGLSLFEHPPITGLGTVVAAPTQTGSGLVAVVGTKAVALLRDAKVLSRAALPAPSYTAAAASRTHVFVSTTDAFLSFDAEAQVPLKTFDWVGGGLQPPAIGPQGHVYAMASNILFVFPPPKGAGQTVGTADGGSSTVGPAKTISPKVKPIIGVLQPAPQQGTAPKPASQSFEPPVTKTGKRLYACQDFDGKGCGAPVAAAFCQEQGFAKASKLDTQTEKAKAETLDGRACEKKKCRVFDLIVCTR
jgi:hypothetical protein